MNQKPEPYKGVSEPEEIPAATPEPCEARIYVSEAVTSHRERDDGYPAIDSVRVIECKDGVQWVLQRRRGDQWQGVAFCRTRAVLIREAEKVVGYIPELALPEHHDGFVEAIPRCSVCGRIATKPTGVIPRHMFCVAVRKLQRSELEEAA
jgi:hypothetical protein